ncbi:MAG TPA: ComF family protein [Anaerolineae bacterium]|nr:ComF family protein [Anaerolineae bacterium]
MGLKDRLRPLLDVLFPPRCVYCDGLGSYLCHRCREEAQPIGSAICIRCGNPMTVRGVCHHCRVDPPEPLRGIRGVFFYKGPIGQSIRSLKYHGVRGLAPILGAYLADYIREHPIPIDALIPVPLHPERQAARGFNQSELLARAVTEILGVPTRADILRRVRATPSQAHLNRAQRRRNVAGAFAVVRRRGLRGRTLLLIDDVATTGATLRACAQPLHEAGAKAIWALTVARAHIPAAREPGPLGATPIEVFLLWDGERKQSAGVAC